MPEKRKRGDSAYAVIQRGLLLLHLTVYISLWSFAVVTLLQLPAFATNVSDALPLHFHTQRLVLAVLIWSLVFMAHLASFVYYVGRSSNTMAERQAYRDGVRDTTAQLPIPIHRLEDVTHNADTWSEEELDPQVKSAFD